MFLVVADVQKEKAWYVFVQDILLKHPNWRKKRSVTIYLPLENDLAETTKFIEAYKEAKRWIQKQNPLTLKDAHDAELAKLIALDSRCDFNITINDGNQQVAVRPREPLPVQMEFKGTDIAEKIQRLEVGEEVLFAPGECKIEGSKLFEDIYLQGGKLRFQTDRPANLELILRDEDGKELAVLRDIRGNISRSMKTANYAGRLPNSPFKLTIGPFTEGAECRSNFTLHFAEWEGQPFSKLAYFNQLLDFFSATAKAHTSEAHWLIDGNSLYRLRSDTLPREMFSDPTDAILFFDKARKVLHKFGIDPIYSHSMMTDQFIDDVEEAYALFYEGKWVQPMKGFTVSMEVSADAKVNLLGKEPQDFHMVYQSDYSILDHVSSIGQVVDDYTSMLCEVESKNDKWVKLLLRPTENSRRILRIDNSENPLGNRMLRGEGEFTRMKTVGGSANGHCSDHHIDLDSTDSSVDRLSPQQAGE